MNFDNDPYTDSRSDLERLQDLVDYRLQAIETTADAAVAQMGSTATAVWVFVVVYIVVETDFFSKLWGGAFGVAVILYQLAAELFSAALGGV